MLVFAESIIGPGINPGLRSFFPPFSAIRLHATHCDEDFGNNDVIDTEDVLILLESWDGECP